MAKIKTAPQVFQMRVDAPLMAALDDLRRAEPDLPDRTEMIRRLIFRAAGKQPQKKT